VTERLDPSVFQLPVEKIRAGYYTDAYFNHSRQVLLADGRHPDVVMQVFQKHDAYLGGMDEAIAILKQCAGTDFSNLRVYALYDGDHVEPHETVLTIEGDYTAFAHLETLYLGTLARRTLITTNTVRTLQAANGKPLIFMPARHDHYRVQSGDGYAAYVAGKVVGAPISVTSDDQASWWGGTGVGTIPHSLIAAYGGDTVLAVERFAAFATPETNITALVDFDNDCVRTAVEVADALGEKLWGVRLDTAEDLTDPSSTQPGVTPELARNVRNALDAAGHAGVKIVVSGGFDVAKITRFEELRVPVDAYGVGSSLIRGAKDFTADIVMVDGVEVHKVGREPRPNGRLELVR
jgi:nicotinate phosphoribosyltransferase